MMEVRSAEAVPPECHAAPPGRRGRLAVAPLLLAWLAATACARTHHASAPERGVELALTPASCTPAERRDDDDLDGMHDACELALAQAFAPLLRADSRDCLWRRDASGARLGGGYLFAAQPIAGGVRIVYMPAFFRDCGWTGPVCLTRSRGCGAHAGDSEVMMVDVALDARGRWSTQALFLSAHCFGRSAGRCRWYRGEALSDFTWAAARERGAPVVWVARGKHALYPSAESCDRGHWFYDSCDGNDVTYRFPVRTTAQNVGSRAAPRGDTGCITTERLPLGAAGAAAGRRECMWNASRAFRGWQSDDTGVAPTSYDRYLGSIAGF